MKLPYKSDQHRIIWERHNGPIPDGWHVHHINSDPRDNRIENLVAMPAHEHLSYHGKNHPIHHRTCPRCGEAFIGHRPWSKWCSARCKQAQRRANGTAYTRPRKGPFVEARTCEQCGTDYIAKRPWARFCSPACKQRAARRAA